MSDAPSLRALIDEYNDAWNRHDPDAIVALHCEDAVFHNHTSGGEAHGREAIRQLVASVFNVFPDIRFEPRRQYLADNLVVQEWTATATHLRPVLYQQRTLAPTGKVIRWDGVDIMPVRDGLFARKDVYASSLEYLRQLGAPV